MATAVRRPVFSVNPEGCPRGAPEQRAQGESTGFGEEFCCSRAPSPDSAAVWSEASARLREAPWLLPGLLCEGLGPLGL